MGPGHSRRAVRIAGWTLGAVLGLLVLAQLLLPSIAADRISDKLGRYGSVRSVSVSAWPAIELLWSHADSVHVRAGSLAMSPSEAASLLHEASGASHVDASVQALKLGPLRFTGATLSKSGSALAAQGTMGAADVAAALPPGVAVSLLGSGGGRVRVHVSGGLFGISAGLDAVAEANAGRLEAHPLLAPLEGLHLTLFSDPRIAVSAVGAIPLGRTPQSYRLTMAARLR
jgi:hypothetical protein